MSTLRNSIHIIIYAGMPHRPKFWHLKEDTRHGSYLASSPVPLFSRAGRRAARFARGRKKKGLVSSDRACVSFSSFSRNLDTSLDISVYLPEKTSS